MALKPLKALLDEDMCKEILIKEAYNEVIDLIEELISYSTNLFGRCIKISEDDITAAPVLLNFRNMIELLDSIFVLACKCITAPSSILLRSMIEALLNIEYILENDKNYLERSMAYLYYSRLESKKTLLIIPECLNGKYGKMMIKVAQDLLAKMDLNDQNKSVDKSLDASYLRIVRDEIIKSGKKRNWYSLFGGPNDIRKLAKHLNREDLYAIVYRFWSIQTHSKDIRRHLKTAEGQAYIRQLRLPEEISMLADFSKLLFHIAMEKIIKKYRTNEYKQYYLWYKETLSGRPKVHMKFK